MLYRDRYRGVVICGKRKKRDQRGKKKPTLRPKDDWEVHPAESLRIVSDDLWQRAHERLAATAQAYLRTTKGTLFGKPSSGIDSAYLLTGLATCGLCDSALTVRFSTKGRHRHGFYRCLCNVQRGTSVCRMNVGLPCRRSTPACSAWSRGNCSTPT